MKKKRLFVLLPAVLVFGALTAVAWALPLRPTVSEREKRTLETVPEFSVSALLDGSWFSGVSVWFSDTFPFRDRWIDVSQQVEQLHGQQDIMIYGDIHAGDEPDTVPAVPVPDAKPAETVPAIVITEAEPDTGEELPAEPEDSPAPTEEPEEPDEGELFFIDSAILLGDTVYPLSRPSPERIGQYASILNRGAELLEGTARVFDILVPGSTSVCLSDAMKERIGIESEEILAETMKNTLSEAVIHVDAMQSLTEHRDEYIFFRTDHHWTALGAYYVYRSWAASAGFEPLELSDCTEQIFEPFYGSLYYKANQNRSLEPDSVVAYTPPGDLQFFISQGTDRPDSLGFEQPVLEDVRGTDKYMCFLRGDHALCTLVNNDIRDGSAVLLIKNSNGNPFSYFLTAHYNRVYVMDYRKYTRQSVAGFCEEYGVQDVIFLMSSGQAQGAAALGLMDHLVGR